MDLSLERDGSVLGSLFHQIIADLKNTSPLWEDFVAKASKLHACLRAAIQAIAAYLDAFQKIADAATNSRGASKEIGTALTRVCLRHKAVESRMKTFTSAIMDCLILPLQEKLEDWKRQVATLDKEHAKEYKRCRTELKKRSSDTLRLQKKARKGQSETIQSLVDSHMQDVTMRRAELEEVERKSLRAAMVEERMRYCSFVYMLQPVVKEECEVMSELGHLQEVMQSIAVVTKEPNLLPQSSEELILESKSNINLYPESPGGNSGSQGCSNSLGSRKSSVCSISSINSSGSSGSPGHHHYQRSLSQLISPAIRLKPGESSDSGFCSSPALTSQTSTTTNQSHAVSTWPPHTQDATQTTDRPHTISTAYEKGHQRPALTVYTFQNPEVITESQKSPATIACRPPLPVRCSSLERPLSSTGNKNPNLSQRQCPSPLPAHITKELPQHQPTYVNMSELASMAALKITNQQHQQAIQQQQQQQSQVIKTLVQQQQQQQQQQQLQLGSPNSNQSTNSSLVSSESPTTPMNSGHQQAQSSSDLSYSGNTMGMASGSLSTITGTTPSSGNSPQTSLQASQNNSPQTPLTNNSIGYMSSSNPPIVNSNSNACSYTNSITNATSSLPCAESTTTSFVLNNNTTDTTSTTTSLMRTTTTTASVIEDELKITETEKNISSSISTTTQQNSNNVTTSTETGTSRGNTTTIGNNQNSLNENQDIPRGSVLEKTSLFEKLEQKQSNNNNPLVIPSSNTHSLSGGRSSHSVSSSLGGSESLYGSRKSEDIYKTSSSSSTSSTLNDKDPDQIYEDSIQELNNLIGELDSFQREHEMKEQQSQPQENSFENAFSSTSEINQNQIHQEQQQSVMSFHADNDSDQISISSLNYSTKSTNNTTNSGGDIKFTYSDSEINRYVSDSKSAGFENPTFAHFNNTIPSATAASTPVSFLSADNRRSNNGYSNDDKVETGSVNSYSSSSRYNYQDKDQSDRTAESNDEDDNKPITIYDNSTLYIPPDIDYMKQNSEIVVLRCKDITTIGAGSNIESINGGERCETPKQRLSSFRSDQTTQRKLSVSSIDSGVTGVSNTDSIHQQYRSCSTTPTPMLSSRYSPTPITPAIEQQGMNECFEEINRLITKSNLKIKDDIKVAITLPHLSPSSPSFSSSSTATTATTTITTVVGNSSSSNITAINTPNVSITTPNSNNNTVTNKITSLKEFKASLDERLRTKPIIQPRPASLSGCVARVARRSSINTNKPPPPVRRSSSVTPSHNLTTPNSPNLAHQNVMNTSAESLPPPPAYLLDRTTNSPSPITVNVAETVKALTVIRHTPASPSTLRRAQNQINQSTVQNNRQHSENVTLNTLNSHNSSHNNELTTIENTAATLITPTISSPLQQQQSQNPTNLMNNKSKLNTFSNDTHSPSFRTSNSNSPGIYAQPKQITKMSSFRTPSPGPQKPSANLLAQLNARLLPNKQQQQSNDYGNNKSGIQQQNQHLQHQDNRSQYTLVHGSNPNSPHHQSHSNQNYNQILSGSSEQIYSRAGEKSYQQQQEHDQTSSAHYDDHTPSNTEKTGSIRAKTKAEFLETLNARLAKQTMSGRAFAVRNLINSKALPDPRLCHESLMDQIKRGATLKRNRTINDRSAPKIH